MTFSKFPRCQRLVRQKLYHEETGFLLNYLTLKISDPVIEKEVLEHRGVQFKRIITPYTIISTISWLTSIYSFYSNKMTSHPIKIMITLPVSIFILLVMQVLCKIGRPTDCRFLAYPAYLVHVIGAVCVYKEWVPEYFN